MSSRTRNDAPDPQTTMETQSARPAGTVHFEQAEFEKERGVSHVTVLRGVSHVTVFLSGADADRERLRVLEHLASRNVPVFLVKMVPGGLSFAMRNEAAAQGEKALRELGADWKTDADLALLSTHAGAMRDLSGVMADIYDALAGVNVRVKQTGDAYNAVLCLVPGDKADAAQNALCERFTLPEPEPLFETLDSGPTPRPAL